jgi:hypothetical protein
MSGNSLTQIHSIKISNSRHFLDITAEVGTHFTELENGGRLSITLEKGKIVKVEAHDKAGNPLHAYSLKMSSSYPGEGSVCYVCAGGGDYGSPPTCYWTPCRWGPIHVPPD